MARSKTRAKVQARREKEAVQAFKDEQAEADGRPRIMTRLYKRVRAGIGIRLDAQETHDLFGLITRLNLRLMVLEGLVDEYQRLLADDDADEAEDDAETGE